MSRRFNWQHVSQFMIVVCMFVTWLLCFNSNEMFCNWFIFRFRLVEIFDQHVFWNVFHQNVRSRVVSHEQRFFYILIRFTIRSYWFWNVFHQNVWSEIASHEWRFFYSFQTWWHVKQLLNFQFRLFLSMRTWSYQK